MRTENPVQLVNLSTAIPFNFRLQDRFDEITQRHLESDWDLRHYYHYRRNGLRIFFVNEADMKEELKNHYGEGEWPEGESNPDTLGFYTSCHSRYIGPCIVVCPEKIMGCAVRLARGGRVDAPVEKIYPTLLLKVVLHEIAHAMMDKNKRRYYRHCELSWGWMCRCFDDEDCDDTWAFDIMRQHQRCGKDNCRDYCRSPFDPDYRKERWYPVIEESLANAFPLAFPFSKKEKRIIRAFIETQPRGYRSGPCWNLRLDELRKTMRSWARLKDDRELNEIIELGNGVAFLDELANKLTTMQPIDEAFDFEKARDDEMLSVGLLPWRVKWAREAAERLVEESTE